MSGNDLKLNNSVYADSVFLKTYRLRNLLSGQITKLLFSMIFASMMCVSASSFIYLPFTPVPVTMQVFTVLLSALFLGKNWAVFSQVMYIAMGLYGLPVFAGFKNGYTALTGPTGGYIAGFILAAYITGYICERTGSENIPVIFKKTGIFAACLAGLLVIYSFGFFHLTLYLYKLNGSSGLSELALKAFYLGVTPFIIFDLLKISILLVIERSKVFNKNY